MYLYNVMSNTEQIPFKIKKDKWILTSAYSISECNKFKGVGIGHILRIYLMRNNEIY